LAIGAIPTVTAIDLPAALKQFHQRHPQVRISLRSGASEVFIERVREGALDIAFLGLPTTAAPKGVRGLELARGELVAVVPPGHPLADRDQVKLHQLADEQFVDFPAGSAGRIQSDEAFAAAGVRREVAFEVSTPDFMARLVRTGLGVGMLPAAFVPALPDLPIVRLGDAPARAEHIIWSRSGPSPAAAAFLGILGISPASGTP